jgi:hypothetical protein
MSPDLYPCKQIQLLSGFGLFTRFGKNTRSPVAEVSRIRRVRDSFQQNEFFLGESGLEPTLQQTKI